jgi:hypothetical protein
MDHPITPVDSLTSGGLPSTRSIKHDLWWCNMITVRSSSVGLYSWEINFNSVKCNYNFTCCFVLVQRSVSQIEGV